jgi:hypothetical protein
MPSFHHALRLVFFYAIVKQKSACLTNRARLSHLLFRNKAMMTKNFHEINRIPIFLMYFFLDLPDKVMVK